MAGLRVSRVAQQLRRAINRLRYGLSPTGPYRFAIRDWAGFSDLNLAARVLGAETLGEGLEPILFNPEEVRAMTVLTPHQDDEVIGVGGTMLKAAAADGSVAIVLLTDGAQRGMAGPSGATLSARDSVAIRNAEIGQVAAAIGADLACLNIDNKTLDVPIDAVSRLARLIEAQAPEILFAPWLLDGAPKHRMANHLLWLAHHKHGVGAKEVFGYQVNNSLFPNVLVDITDQIDGKQALLRLYKSQNARFRRYDHLALSLAGWNARFLPSKLPDDRPRYVEIFFALPMPAFVELVERFYFRRLIDTYLGSRRIATQMAELHFQVTGHKPTVL